MSAYMISPFGVVIIGIYSAVVLALIGLPMWRLLKRWSWWRYPTLLVVLPLLAAPWAEEIWIATHFERLCRDAGVKVYRQVEADGFVDATYIKERPTGEMNVFKLLYDDPQKLAEFDRGGLKFKETLYADGSVWHAERRSDGVYGAFLMRPRGRYFWVESKTLDSQGWRMVATESYVQDRQTGSILAHELRGARAPNTAESFWLRFFGDQGKGCLGPLDQPEMSKRSGLLYEYVLTAKKSN